MSESEKELINIQKRANKKSGLPPYLPFLFPSLVISIQSVTKPHLLPFLPCFS